MKKSNPYLDTLSEHKEMMTKLEKLIDDMENLKADSYWAYTKEYWMGLLEASIILIKKIKEDLG